MHTLYLALLSMLVVALSILALPFLKNHSIFHKSYIAIAAATVLLATMLYQHYGAYKELQQWLAEGRQHYQLLNTLDRLGGLDGIIARIQQKVTAHPLDTEGWFILGKMLLIKQDYQHAKIAFKKAHELQPDNQKIKQYYEMTVLHTVADRDNI